MLYYLAVACVFGAQVSINVDDHTDVPIDPSRPLHLGGFNFVSVVLAARILRLLRLPLNLPFVRTISVAIANTMPVIMRCAVLFFTWLFFWVHVAQALFSGPQGLHSQHAGETRQRRLALDATPWASDRRAWNFDGPVQSIFSLYMVTVLSRWPELEAAGGIVIGSVACDIFFAVFHLSMTMVLLPVLLGACFSRPPSHPTS